MSEAKPILSDNILKTENKAEKKKKEKAKVFKVKFGLKLKLVTALLTLTMIVILSMAFYFTNRESDLLRSNIESNALAQMNNFELIVSKNLGMSDLVIFDIIELFKKDSSFKYANVTDTDGIIINSSDIDTVGTVAEDEHVKAALAGDSREVRKFYISDPDETEGMIYDFIQPVYSRHTDKVIAVIRLAYSDIIVRTKVKQARQIILIITLVFVSFSIIAAIILATVTTGPLHKLSEGVSIIGTGNLDYKIKVKSSDEFGRLADQFNAMTIELKDAKDKEIESRIMEEQLELAQEIQEGLNPMGFYNRRGVQIKGFTRAAKGVGGDYFDYIDIDDASVGVLISDVSGKGVPASLVMVMIRTVFVSSVGHKEKNMQCKNIVRSINDALSADFAIDKFATLFFFIFNRETETLSFSNAGHGPLFCYRAKRNKCTVTPLDGVPIGIMEDVEYNQAVVPFEVGDIVVLYTDGITEMRNSEKDEYGRLRLQKLVIDNADKNADELVDLIVNDVEEFRGETPPHDDMTTLVFKRVE